MLRSSVLIMAMLVSAPPALAQDNPVEPTQATPASDAEHATNGPTKRTRWAIGGSHGIGVQINSSREIDVSSLWVRWSRILGGTADANATTFLGGQPAFAVELTPLSYFRQSPGAWGAGANILYEHRFRPLQSVRPTVRAGAGALYATEEVPPGETRYNFSLFIGAGIEVAAFGDKAIQIDYRLHHISNADTGVENPGINAHTMVLGLAWGF